MTKSKITISFLVYKVVKSWQIDIKKGTSQKKCTKQKDINMKKYYLIQLFYNKTKSLSSTLVNLWQICVCLLFVGLFLLLYFRGCTWEFFSPMREIFPRFFLAILKAKSADLNTKIRHSQNFTKILVKNWVNFWVNSKVNFQGKS